MALKAVIFDLFDTLVYVQPTGMREQALARVTAAGLEQKAWSRAWRQTQPAAMRGQVRFLRDRVVAALELVGADASAEFADELAGLFVCRDYPQLFPEVRGALSEVRARGYRIGLIANTTYYDRSNFDAFGLEPLFDTLVFSFEVGLVKPEPGIFLLAAKRLDVPPAACAFIDDRLDYLQGARAVAMTAVHLRRPGRPAHPSTGASDLQVADLAELLAWLPARAAEAE